MKTTIYALLDPRDGKVRHVGRTRRRLAVRLGNHLHWARTLRTNSPRGVWLRELLSLGLRPWIVGLKEAEAVAADLVERDLIAAYPDLLNVTYNRAPVERPGVEWCEPAPAIGAQPWPTCVGMQTTEALTVD